MGTMEACNVAQLMVRSWQRQLCQFKTKKTGLLHHRNIRTHVNLGKHMHFLFLWLIVVLDFVEQGDDCIGEKHSL